MANPIINYDGSITANPQQVVQPKKVEEIQAVLRDRTQYPSPVRAKGSFHSLTPCAASDGTMIDMSKMNKIIAIDPVGKTLTAQAGLQFIKASDALREKDLQFHTNIEIGNMTLGSAACCHSKDALDGIELGQVNSYVTKIKWVTPAGDLAEASESDNPDLLRKVRTARPPASVSTSSKPVVPSRVERWCCSSPMPPIAIRTLSPDLRKTPLPAPTPAGVPVRIMSPG
jgi:FAD/FMN-containing dehydrogenase